jgi:poly-beta-1,6-N-acetyl-D-glucosamine synthase
MMSITEIKILFDLAFTLSLLIYCGLIIKYSIAWVLYPEQKKTGAIKTTKISVIVAVRNESKNIPAVVHSLVEQNYSGPYEIIFSDDHSEDDTVQLLEDINKGLKGRIMIIKADSSARPGKKAAIERAILHASGELIVTTDADCIAGPDWISSVAQLYQFTNISMITGLVCIRGYRGFIQKFEALEFLALSGSGAASVITGKPIMCNGANLAFNRNVFEEAGGYSYGNSSVSGDDTFLMLKINAMQKKIIFLKNKEAIISTSPQDSIHSYLNQRKRWASKIKFYKERRIPLTGILIFLANFSILYMLAAAITGYSWWFFAVLLFSFKATADFIWLLLLTSFVNQRRLLLLFLPFQLLYPVYSLSAFFFSLFPGTFSWKGRKTSA